MLLTPHALMRRRMNINYVTEALTPEELVMITYYCI